MTDHTQWDATYNAIKESGFSIRQASGMNYNTAVPDILPVLRTFQGVLDRLTPQADEGDLAGLGEEVANWSEERVRATRVLLDD